MVFFINGTSEVKDFPCGVEVVFWLNVVFLFSFLVCLFDGLSSLTEQIDRLVLFLVVRVFGIT